MADLYSHQFADNTRLAKSKTVIVTGLGSYNLIRIPKFALVKAIYLYISNTIAGTSPTLTIGFSGNGETADVDAFLLNRILAGMYATFQETSALAVGKGGKYFDSASGAITATIGGTAATAGKFHVFADYVVIH